MICRNCGCNKWSMHDDAGCARHPKCKASPGTDRDAFIARKPKRKSRFAEPRDLCVD